MSPSAWSSTRRVACALRALAFTLCWLVTLPCRSADLAPEERAEADALQVAGTLGDFVRVEDVAFDGRVAHVLYPGGLVTFDSSGRPLSILGPAQGLRGGRPLALVRTDGALAIRTEATLCRLPAAGVPRATARLACTPAAAPRRRPPQLAIYRGARVTARAVHGQRALVGTSRGAYLDGRRLDPGQRSLTDPHVTALAVFRERLFVGTFNSGLARESHADPVPDGTPADGTLAGGKQPPLLEEVSCGGRLVNALLTTPEALYVGTSEGLFRSTEGTSCTRIDWVADAVVGLAFDGTSVWAASPGALYRIRESSGPPSDVWWMPGGSRSLQKIAASPGHVWVASEDRGAIHLRPTAQLTAKDRPFEVHDASTGEVPSWGLSVSPLPDGGALLASLRDGLFLLGTSRAPRAVPAPVGPWGLATLTTLGGVWVGTQQGAAFLPHAVLSAAPSATNRSASALRIGGLPDERVHCFAVDPRTRGEEELIWIGTENGLAWIPRTLGS